MSASTGKEASLQEPSASMSLMFLNKKTWVSDISRLKIPLRFALVSRAYLRLHQDGADGVLTIQEFTDQIKGEFSSAPAKDISESDALALLENLRSEESGLAQ